LGNKIYKLRKSAYHQRKSEDNSSSPPNVRTFFPACVDLRHYTKLPVTVHRRGYGGVQRIRQLLRVHGFYHVQIWTSSEFLRFVSLQMTDEVPSDLRAFLKQLRNTKQNRNEVNA
jgi:hypothetical protein